jgi:hypothetical protein
MIEAELLATVRDALRYTRVWTTSETFTTSMGQVSYSLNPPQDTQVARVLNVWENSNEKVPQNLRRRPDKSPSWRYYFKLETRELVLPGMADSEPADLVVEYALVPEVLNALPDGLVDEFEDTFIDGALQRMLTHGNRPYSNQGLGMYHARRYRNSLARIRRSRLSGHAESGWGADFPLVTRSRSLR